MEWPNILETNDIEMANMAAASGLYIQARYDLDRHMYIFIKKIPRNNKRGA